MNATINLEEYDTPEKVAKLGDIDPAFAEALQARPPMPLDLSDVPALRKTVTWLEEEIVKRLPSLPPTVKQTNVTIPLRDGASMDSILVYPTETAYTPGNGCPIVVLWHGGGNTIGSPLQVLPRARGLARLLSCAVLCPDYRLAPEHPFPTGVLDAWDSVLFASKADNFQALNLTIDHSKGFIIGGLSAGGNFAGVLAQKALEEGLTPPLTGQYLGWPSYFVDPSNVPEKYRHLWFAYEQNANDPTQSWQDVLHFLLKSTRIDKDSNLYSPMNPLGDRVQKHVGLPKAYVQASGMDSLRDDALVYSRILRDAGVDCWTQCYSGLPHVSEIFYAELAVSKQQAGDTARGFAWMLGRRKGEWEEEKADELMCIPVLS